MNREEILPSRRRPLLHFAVVGSIFQGSCPSVEGMSKHSACSAPKGDEQDRQINGSKIGLPISVGQCYRKRPHPGFGKTGRRKGEFVQSEQTPWQDQPRKPRVGLFVTCLVDLFRPSVGFAAIKLLNQAGCEVGVPETQTCCGQPAYNSGDRADAAAIARQVIAAFEAYDYVVAPSGSCAGMLRIHFPALLRDEPAWSERAERFGEKVHELISFLVDIRGMTKVDARYYGTATYHDSCSGLRELGIKNQPRRLLASVDGLTLKEMPDAETCCGFGGTFSVKYPDISNALVEKKTDAIRTVESDLLLAGDLGCLLNIAGKIKRQGTPQAVRHVAEVLADMTDEPAIGDSSKIARS